MSEAVDVLRNLRSRLKDKRDQYRRARELGSVDTARMRAKENAMDNAIVITERFIDTYEEFDGE